jgi:hypothetical protein
VVPEDITMQMARPFDHTMSGDVRYLGARINHSGSMIEDTIANELASRLGDPREVEPATVLETGPGELARRNNVKLLLHVAAMIGAYAYGYRLVADIEHCVQNALEYVETRAAGKQALRSVIFPLFGGRAGRKELEAMVRKLFDVAIAYLETSPPGKIDLVYFLNRTELEWTICEAVLAKDERVIIDRWDSRLRKRAGRRA